MTMTTEIARVRCFLAVSVFVSLLPLLCFAVRISLSQRNLRGMKKEKKELLVKAWFMAQRDRTEKPTFSLNLARLITCSRSGDRD